MSDLRMNLLLDMIGGQENLPPQLHPAQTLVVDAETQDEEPPAIVRDPNLIPPSQLRPGVNTVGPGASPAVVMGENGSFPLPSGKGEAAPLGICFTPFGALTKYCYKFVPKQWKQPLASSFFDHNKIYQREWDLYYLHTNYSGVLFFVAEHQLQSLITEINDFFPSANLSVGEEERADYLIIDFEDLPQQYRPRWLGRCNSRPQHNSWLLQLQHEPATMLPDAGDSSLEAFKTKIDEAREANSKRTNISKLKKHQQRLNNRERWMSETLRAQRYLGFLPKKEDSLMPDMADLTITQFDHASPSPHPFNNEPIFIAIDVEAWEKPPRMITEVGVATLDTRDLKGHAPGEIGLDWHKHIRGRHFRILEYKDYVNQRYVQGCPDRFEFGKSQLIGKDSMAPILASCFREPYGKEPSDTSQLALQANEPQARNIIVVGHDLGQDIQYCQQLGFNVFNRGDIINTIDTVNLFRAYFEDPNPSSLGRILYEFDISGWHLHNAGNDAVYTLQAMLAICVKMASQRYTEGTKKREEDTENHEQIPIENANEKAKEDFEGWNSTDDDNGGVRLPQIDQDFRPKPERAPRGQGSQTGQSGLYTLIGNPLDV